MIPNLEKFVVDTENSQDKSTKIINDTVEKHWIVQNYILVIILGVVFITLIGIYLRWIYLDVAALIMSSIFLGALYLCLSLGLTLTYKILGFANFAHAEYFLVGAYVGVSWSLIVDIEDARLTDIGFVILLAFLISGIVALLSDILVFRPLRKRGSSPETLMISSIGVGIILRNLVSLFFSGQTSYYRWYDFNANNVDNSLSFPTIQFGARKSLVRIRLPWRGDIGYNLSLESIITILVTVLLVGGLIYMMQYTKVGKALRATADNRDLAESSGIDTEKMIWLVWFIGGGLAGVAGALFATSFGVIPFIGFLFLLPAFAVVVFGGVGSLKGSIVASFVIASIQQISTAYLSGMENVLELIAELVNNPEIERSGLNAYQTIVPFFVIILVLLFKPHGLYGQEVAE